MRTRVCKKHMADILGTREELREVFGHYVSDQGLPETEKADVYHYDFDRAVDFPVSRSVYRRAEVPD